MKQYMFEKIQLKGVPGLKQKAENYHEIIHQYAKEGWELVQIFSPPTSLYGGASYMELIFSKNV